AGDGGRPEVPGLAVAAELRLCRLRRALRPAGDLLRRRRPNAVRLGGGARRRPARRARGQDRPRDPAAAAPHPARAGRGDGEAEDAMDVRAAWLRMCAQVRNAGQPGIGFCAVSAVDQALWDLKARLLGVPLVVLLGAAHEDVPIYGSGGFCSYTDERLCEQLGGWAEAGIPRVKMKVGREPERDPTRLDAAREVIGDDVALYVDANGAFTRKE